MFADATKFDILFLMQRHFFKVFFDSLYIHRCCIGSLENNNMKHISLLNVTQHQPLVFLTGFVSLCKQCLGSKHFKCTLALLQKHHSILRCQPNILWRMKLCQFQWIRKHFKYTHIQSQKTAQTNLVLKRGRVFIAHTLINPSHCKALQRIIQIKYWETADYG